MTHVKGSVMHTACFFLLSVGYLKTHTHTLASFSGFKHQLLFQTIILDRLVLPSYKNKFDCSGMKVHGNEN